jgi:ABC-type multidrug transport system fused ATPase/permease subunit
MALRSSRALLLGAVASQILASLGFPAQLLVMRLLVNRVVEGRPRGELASLAFGLVGVFIVQRLAALSTSSLLTLARQHSAAHAVSEFLAKASTVDAGHLIDPAFQDRMRHAGEAADDQFSSVIFGFVGLTSGTAGLLGLTTVLATVSPLVALLVLCSLVPWVLAEQYGFNVVRRTRLALVPQRREQSYLRGLVTESEAAQELTASSAGRSVARRHARLTADLLAAERPAHLRQFAVIAAGNLLAAIPLAIAFGYTAITAGRGTASAGDVVAVIAALSAFHSTTGNLANSLSGLLAHGPYLQDYFDFLATPRLLSIPAVPHVLPGTLAPGVTFDRVTYTYPGSDAPALSGATMGIEPGQLVALVGENGAGKSTLVKLLLRLYDPDHGEVTIAGVPLTACDPADIRSRIATVFQDYARYQFTVRDVVAMGAPDRPIDDEQVRTALEAAGLEAFVTGLERGIDTRVGRLFPGGHDISGGQWQRLALARLFYRDADILILDEPTSALDPEGEEATFRRLRDRLGDRCGLVISHRFSTVRVADTIAVLHRGELVEQGTHQCLMAEGGRYAHLFDLQAAGYR